MIRVASDGILRVYTISPIAENLKIPSAGTDKRNERERWDVLSHGYDDCR